MLTGARQTRGPSLPVQLTADDFHPRVQVATEQDMAKGMFFNGVLDAVETLLDVRARALCLVASGEKRFIDFLNYPITAFLHLSFTAAELLAPKVGGIPQAFRTLGMQACSDFLASGVGKTLLVLVDAPERILSAVPTAFRTAVTYGERTSELVGPGRCVITMRRDFMPHPYHEGVLLTAVRTMGAEDVQVVGTSLGALDTRYDIRWSPKPKTGGAR